MTGHSADNLPSNSKLFAEDTSLFSVFRNIYASSLNLNNDLIKISYWAFQWRMSFNPDPTKQAQEVIFNRKIQTLNHLLIYFIQSPVMQINSPKTPWYYSRYSIRF